MKNLWVVILFLVIVYLLILMRNGIYIGVGTWDLNKEGAGGFQYILQILSKLAWLIIPVFIYGLIEYLGKRISLKISLFHILLITGVIVIELLSIEFLGLAQTGLIIGSLIVFGVNVFASYKS